jgi:hypothetical protein
LQSDCWAFGITLFELYTFGAKPYPDGDDVSIAKRVISGERNKLPDNCPPKLELLVHQCWEMDPEKRPTFKEIHTSISNLMVLAKSLSRTNSYINLNDEVTGLGDSSQSDSRYSDLSDLIVKDPK